MKVNIYDELKEIYKEKKIYLDNIYVGIIYVGII